MEEHDQWAGPPACLRSSVHLYSSPALAVMIRPTSHSIPSLTGLGTRIKVQLGSGSADFTSLCRLQALPRLPLASRLFCPSQLILCLLLTIFFLLWDVLNKMFKLCRIIPVELCRKNLRMELRNKWEFILKPCSSKAVSPVHTLRSGFRGDNNAMF